jgi:hypothetical protein
MFKSDEPFVDFDFRLSPVDRNLVTPKLNPTGHELPTCHRSSFVIFVLDERESSVLTFVSSRGIDDDIDDT